MNPDIMKKNRFVIALFLFLAIDMLHGQTAEEIIGTLSSARMQGRGYARGGDRKAAEYLAGLIEKAGLLPLTDSYYQYFSLDANTFPGKMKLEINGRKLLPAADYIADPASPSLRGSFAPWHLTQADILNGRAGAILDGAKGTIVLLHGFPGSLTPVQKELIDNWTAHQIMLNPHGIRALAVVTDDRLTFGVSSRMSAIPLLYIRADALPDSVVHIRTEVESVYVQDYPARNLAAIVKGTTCPDSFLVFTAHYDHLGLMGKKTFFPGANDNASGVSMVIQLARYFAAHPQRFSVAFLFFSGEEAGLYGSRYFAAHPRFDLDKVKFLVNLDLVGSGAEGAMVVNATAFPETFSRLNDLNEAGHWVKELRRRGKACNSDHCPFFEKGVPCFFIYTLGEGTEYHSTGDRADTLPLTAFDGMVKLITVFATTF